MSEGAPPGRPSTNRRAVSKRRFLGNVALLIALVASVAIWFHNHIQQHTVESLFVGGTLTIWGLFEIIRATLEWAAEDQMKALPQRLLGHRGCTEYLGLALGLSLLLHCVTSSINIEYEPTGAARPGYKVVVLYRTNGLPFMSPLEVTSEKRIEGRPYFFRGRSVALRIVMIEPRGYEPIDIEFGWGTAKHLKVPVGFKPKNFHLLRVVPSTRLMNPLPEPGQAVATEHELEIVCAGKIYVATNLCKQVLYVGAGAQDMKEVIGREKSEIRTTKFDQLLAKINFPAESRSTVIDRWEKNPRLYETGEFAKADEVQLTVRRKGDPNPTVTTRIKIEEVYEIQTVFLEPTR